MKNKNIAGVYTTGRAISGALNNHTRISVKKKQFTRHLNLRINKITSSLLPGCSKAIEVVIAATRTNFLSPFASEIFSELISPSLSTTDGQTVQMEAETFGLFPELDERRNKAKTTEKPLTID